MPDLIRKRRGPLAEVERIRQLWEDHAPAFEEHFNKITSASEFLFKARQYPAKKQQELKRQNRVAPVTVDAWDTSRYVASELTDAEIYLDVVPDVPEELVAEQMPEMDPATGELKAPTLKPKRDPRWAKWALEHEVFDEATGFAQALDRIVFKAVASRAGAGFLEWAPEQGTRGRIYLDYESPTRIIWHSDFLHPHQPGNPFVIRQRELDYDWIVNCSGWDNVDKLQPDNGVMDPQAERSMSQQQRLKARKVTVLYCWEMYDTTVKRKLEHTHEPEELPKAEQYLACSECPWQSGMQGSETFPEQTPCPDCGAQADLIKLTGRMVPTEAYLKGKRFRIVAPKCPTAGPLVDSGWPGDPPMYPVFYLVLNTDPDEFGGMSDIEWGADLFVMKNTMFREAYEQMIHNRDHLISRLGAFTDAAGRPYRFDGSGEWEIFVEGDEDFNAIKHFQGSGMSPALPPFVNMIDTALRQTRGIGQLGVPPEGLKGIQVGVSNRFMESGDVPVKHKLEVLRRHLSILFTNWHAMQRNLWTVADWVGYVGEDGERAHRAMRGEELPAVRVNVRGQPSIDVADMEKAMALKDLLTTIPPLSPAALTIIGRAANIPSEWIKELVKERTAPPTGGAVPGTAPAPMPGTAPPGMNGMASGAVPMPQAA